MKLGRFPFCGVREERELADDERVAAGIQQRPVEAALVVLEDAQPGDPAREAHGRLGRVAVPDTDEHQKTAAARAHRVSVDAHRRARDPLDDCAHALDS